MLKFLKVCALAAFVVLVFSADAQAADSVFKIVVKKGVALFREIRTIVFVLGGFGLVGLAVASIFGRPMWKWFAFLAMGLVVIAVAGAIVTYFAGDDWQTATDGAAGISAGGSMDNTLT